MLNQHKKFTYVFQPISGSVRMRRRKAAPFVPDGGEDGRPGGQGGP